MDNIFTFHIVKKALQILRQVYRLLKTFHIDFIMGCIKRQKWVDIINFIRFRLPLLHHHSKARIMRAFSMLLISTRLELRIALQCHGNVVAVVTCGHTARFAYTSVLVAR